MKQIQENHFIINYHLLLVTLMVQLVQNQQNLFNLKQLQNELQSKVKKKQNLVIMAIIMKLELLVTYLEREINGIKDHSLQLKMEVDQDIFILKNLLNIVVIMMKFSYMQVHIHVKIIQKERQKYGK
jgi:ABC-type transport system involved in multi-copper enzyme maturation permease subunit